MTLLLRHRALVILTLFRPADLTIRLAFRRVDRNVVRPANGGELHDPGKAPWSASIRSLLGDGIKLRDFFGG